MSKETPDKTSAGWGCLYMLVIAGFFITLGAALIGGSPFWPLAFGLAMILCFVKAYHNEKEKSNNG